MKTREQIRDEIIALNKPYLLLALPTGLGKTKIALDVIFETFPKQFHLPPTKILVVYPKLNLKQNWIDEINKWGFGNRIGDFTFTTYNSLHKYAGERWDAVIFDEGHHITERVLEIIALMKYNQALILSATVKMGLHYKLGTLMPGLKTYKVMMKDAIDNKILPDPRIILWPLTYKLVGQTETLIKNPKIKSPVKEIPFEMRFRYNDKQCKYIIKCTEAQYAGEMDRLVEYYKKKTIAGNSKLKNLWLLKAGERLKWLASKKSEYVKQLLAQLQNERTLTFCASIEQVELLGKNCIHSKNKLAQGVLDDFNSGKIDHITACAMLDEGVNLVNCRVAIFANINASERIQIQRVGRSLRHESPVIIIPYYKHSREHEIIIQMLAGYNQDLITVIHDAKELKL